MHPLSSQPKPTNRGEEEEEDQGRNPLRSLSGLQLRLLGKFEIARLRDALSVNKGVFKRWDVCHKMESVNCQMAEGRQGNLLFQCLLCPNPTYLPT